MTVKCTWKGCDAVFTTNSNLKRHVKNVHVKDPSYVCPHAKCKAAFHNARALQRHKLRVHVKNRSYKCRFCPKAFVIYDTYYRHERSVHGIPITTKTELEDIPIEEPSFACDDCESYFEDKDNLTSHILTEHNDGEQFKCTWNGCDAVVLSKSSLKRHIKIVHGNARPFICPVPKCGSSFRTGYDLKRHNLGVHTKDGVFKCPQCDKTFSLNDKLRRHEKEVHGMVVVQTSSDVIRFEIPEFICAECNAHFKRKYSLANHISTQHGECEYFICHDCGRRFNRKNNLKKHILGRHGANCSKPARRHAIQCVLCKQSYLFIYQLHEHYTETHGIDLNIQKLSFPSIEEFFMWKKKIEDSTITRFRLEKNSRTKQSYICHRSGCYNVKLSDRKRAPLVRGSKKLNGHCPAEMKVCRNKTDSSYTVTFIQTHVGHSANDRNELKFVFLHKDDRKKLAKLVSSGVSKRQIIADQLKGDDTLLCDFMDANVEKKDLLSNKDLCNIESSYNVKYKRNSVEPPDDSKNIEAFADEFRESVLLYKRQGESPPEKFSDCGLKYDDIILVFMCPSQEKMLKKHGNTIVCIDGVRLASLDDFTMHFLLVIDYDGEGFPAAYVFSNRNDDSLIKVFLRCIKERIGERVTPQTLLSDMQEHYYNAWLQEMGKAEMHLHCMWHVWQVWKKHLPKANKKLRQDLYDLSTEANVYRFHEKLDKFLLLGDNAKANEFLKYFYEEYCREEEYTSWSYAHRIHCSVSTTTHLESFHPTLKYLHDCGKQAKDVYSGLRMVVNFVKQKMSLLLGKVIRGKLTSQLTALRQAHKHVENKGEVSVLKIDDVWLVPSFQVPTDGCDVMYVVRKIRDTCPAEEDEDIRACYMMCSECDECAHKYSCSCVENGIRLHMCKHIHAVVISERTITPSPIFDENLLSSSPEPVLREITNVVDNKTVTDEQRKLLIKNFSKLLDYVHTIEQFTMINRFIDQMEEQIRTGCPDGS